MLFIRLSLIAVILITAQTTVPVQADSREVAQELTMAISLMLRDPAISGRGVALENYEAERYNHSITVQYTGNEGDSVNKQVRDTAEAALRIGHLLIDKGFSPPGKHLIIKMALRSRNVGLINTFSVRYEWADVLALAKAKARVAELASKGKIETIWLEYWPIMCLNIPPRELFAGGDGDPEEPEDVDNPAGKDLSCHRRR